MMPLFIHGRTDVGQERSRNEDSFRTVSRGDQARLLIVCDGMGGHGGGDVASRVACDRIEHVLAAPPLHEPPNAIYNALVEADQAIADAAQNSPDATMGTTAVVSWVQDDQLWVGWVGDSRFYLFRNGEMTEQSVDHTRVQEMLARGILTPEQARDHPDGHILTQALGGGKSQDVQIRPSVWNEPTTLEEGDVVLMCSDGLYDLIDDHELYELIQGLHFQEAVDRLTDEANHRGGHDNITTVLMVVGQPTVPGRTPAPPPQPLPAKTPLAAPTTPRTQTAPEPQERNAPTRRRKKNPEPTSKRVLVAGIAAILVIAFAVVWFIAGTLNDLFEPTPVEALENTPLPLLPETETETGGSAASESESPENPAPTQTNGADATEPAEAETGAADSDGPEQETREGASNEPDPGGGEDAAAPTGEGASSNADDPVEITP